MTVHTAMPVAFGLMLTCLTQFCLAQVGEKVVLPSEVRVQDVSQHYEPRSLKGMTPRQMMKWMDSGEITSIDPFNEGWPEELPRVDIWNGSAEDVIRTQFERGRKEEVNAKNPLRFSQESKPLPRSGLIKFRMNSKSQVEGLRLLTMALRWDPNKSWVALAEDQNVATQPSFIYTDRFGLPIAFVEISPARAARLAELVLAAARASTPIKGKTLKYPEPEGYGITGHTWPSYFAIRMSGDQRGLILSVNASSGDAHEVYEESRRRERGEKEDVGWTNARALEYAQKWLLEDLPRQLAAEKGSHEQPTIHGFECPAAYVESMTVLTPAGVERMLQAATRILEIAVTQPALMPRNITTVAIITAGELGFTRLSGKIDVIAATLPKPSAWELQRKRLEVELASANAKLESSAEAGVAEFVRRSRQFGSDNTFTKESEGFSASTRSLFRETRSTRDALEKLSEQTAKDEPDRSAADQRRAIALVRRQLAVRNDQTELAAWAKSTDRGADWAYRRLREINADAANEVAEGRLATQTANIELYDFAREYLRLAPARSRKFIQNLTEIRRNQLITITGAYGEPQTVNQLLSAVTNPERKEANRKEALRQLVPYEFPDLYPSPEIDEELARTLESGLKSRKVPAPDDEESERQLFDSLTSQLGFSLAERDPVRHWALVESLLPAKDHPNFARFNGTVLKLLVPGALLKPETLGKEIHRLAIERLNDPASVDNFLLISWLGDFRDQRDKIAALANARPEELGKDKSGNDIRRTKAQEQQNLARQIASIWDEPDAETRVKMLTAFVLGWYRFGGLEESRWVRLEREIGREMRTLSPEERAAILNYYDQLSAVWLKDIAGRDPESLEKAARIRRMLATSR